MTDTAALVEVFTTNEHLYRIVGDEPLGWILATIPFICRDLYHAWPMRDRVQLIRDNLLQRLKYRTTDEAAEIIIKAMEDTGASLVGSTLTQILLSTLARPLAPHWWNADIDVLEHKVPIDYQRTFCPASCATTGSECARERAGWCANCRVHVGTGASLDQASFVEAQMCSAFVTGSSCHRHHLRREPQSKTTYIDGAMGKREIVSLSRMCVLRLGAPQIRVSFLTPVDNDESRSGMVMRFDLEVNRAFCRFGRAPFLGLPNPYVLLGRATTARDHASKGRITKYAKRGFTVLKEQHLRAVDEGLVDFVRCRRDIDAIAKRNPNVSKLRRTGDT